MRRPFFRGTGTALVTPFDRSGAVDEKALRSLVRRQVRGGVEAILPAGTTGEGATLTDAELVRVIEIVKSEVVSAGSGRVPVIPGTGANSTARAIRLSELAAIAGADAVLSVGPFYNKPTQEGYYRHFASIAEACDLPVVLYNVPGRTAGNISAETTLRLAEKVRAVCGIKEASGNFSQVMEILRNRPAGFGVWSGDDAVTLPLVALGADGVVSVVSNQIPGKFSKMVRLCLAGKFAAAAKLHYELLPLMEVNFIESNPIPVKTSLAMMKLIGEQFRLPLVPIGDGNRRELARILKSLKLI